MQQKLEKKIILITELISLFKLTFKKTKLENLKHAMGMSQNPRELSHGKKKINHIVEVLCRSRMRK